MKQIPRKSMLILIGTVAATAVCALVFMLVLKPAFFDSEEFDPEDIITIAACPLEEGFHVEAGEEIKASLYNIVAVMKDGNRVSINELPLKLSMKPDTAPLHGHDFKVSIIAEAESGKSFELEAETLIDREVMEEYKVGLYSPKEVTAVLYVNGDLEIHGKGAMKNYTSGLVPWEGEQVTYLTWIDEGISIESMDYWFEANDEFIGAKCSIPKTVKTMIGCFEGCIAMTEAPDLTYASALVDMTDCFNGCSSLQKVGVLPENLKTADRTFYECSSLIYGADVTNAMNVESMKECYAGDVSLVKAVTPDSVKYMESCYEGCINLKEGNIPGKVENIDSAWAGCTALEKVTGKIPKGCEGGEGAFEGCRMLSHRKFVTTKQELKTKVVNHTITS